MYCTAHGAYIIFASWGVVGEISVEIHKFIPRTVYWIAVGNIWMIILRLVSEFASFIWQ